MRVLRGWSPEQAAAQADKLAEVATHFGVFRVAGEQRYVHEQVDAPGSAAQEAEADALAHCLVTGEAAPSARMHKPLVKGVPGSQPGGALLVSFNSPPFESYGKDQGSNAPVSVSTVFRYTNALNHLLAQPRRRIALGDATIVFWADHAEPSWKTRSPSFSAGRPTRPKTRPRKTGSASTRHASF